MADRRCAGVSTWLFDCFSPASTAWLRLSWAALVLLILARPSFRGRSRADLLAAVDLGAASGLLTVLYFEAVARIPLGTATALEFLGPLALLTQQVGDRFTGLSGLAVSMLSAAIVVAPLADVGGVISGLDVQALLVSFGAAILLPILPYACEMLALRNLTTGTFCTLMSLEPAIGTVVGLVLLGQVPARSYWASWW